MEEEKIRVLLITGNLSPMHNGRVINPLLRATMEASGHFLVKTCEMFSDLSAEALEGYELLLINYDGMEAQIGHNEAKISATPLGERAERNICEFVERGGGVIFYHSSCLVRAPFSAPYRALCGTVMSEDAYARYRDTGYTVDVRPGHPVTEGVNAHWKLCDDDFFNWIDADPASTVLATIHDPVNDRDVPVMWLRTIGKGRVFCTTLGHQQDTVRRLDFVRLLLRGADWAARGEITVPMPDRESDDNWMRGWPWYYASPRGRAY